MRICHLYSLVDVFMNHKLTIILKEREIQDHLFICVTMGVKHISLIRIVNKSSKLSELVILLCIALLMVLPYMARQH